MKKEVVRCILVNPNVDPVEIEIPNDYKFWQKLVGGLVQAIYPFEEEVAIICNDEGKLMGLEENRILWTCESIKSSVPYDYIAGPFLIFNAPSDSEDFVDMTDEQIRKYLDMYNLEWCQRRFMEYNRMQRTKRMEKTSR